jgi:hypothetical protein
MNARLLLVLTVLTVCACESDRTCDPNADGPVGLGPHGDPPNIEALGDTSVVLGDTLRMTASAVDPDGDSVTYDLTVCLRDTSELDYVADAYLDSLTGDFWFVAGARDLPDRNFVITARDSEG